MWFYAFNLCLCQVEPLGRLGESLVDHAVRNRNISARALLPFFIGEFYLDNSFQMMNR